MIKKQLIRRNVWGYEKIDFPSENWKFGNSCLGNRLTGCRVEEIHDTGSIGEVSEETIICIDWYVSCKKNLNIIHKSLETFLS